MQFARRKQILLGLMVLSILPILQYLDLREFTDPDLSMSIIGRFLGMIGVLIILWQMLLGVRQLVSWVIPDLIWVNNLHKLMGKYGFLLIALHPVLMVLYYAGVGVNLLVPRFQTQFDIYKSVGVLAFTLLSTVWILSALLRSRLKFRPWKRIHFIVYAVLPLVILHALNIGTTSRTTGLATYWYLILSIYLLIVVYRLGMQMGIWKAKYQVVEMKQITPDVMQITMAPDHPTRFINPLPGQFIYIQTTRFGESHPFTASHFQASTKQVSISPKASGKFSSSLHQLHIGDTVFLDGPYGVFTREAYNTLKPLIVIAGGIGITPFVRLLEKVRTGWKNKVTLIFGNKMEADIAFHSQITDVAKYNRGFSAVHVLSHQPDFDGEQGHITLELIQKHVPDNLAKYEFFVCGPVPMMNKLIPALRQAGVPPRQIHAEKFSL